jgi:hypothetical protein
MKTPMFITSFMLAMCPLVLIVLLSFGCSIVTPPTYHETEYVNYIEIAIAASEGICNSDETQKLAALSTRAGLYSAYLPNNELMARGAEQLDKTIQTLRGVEAPSMSYCTMKLRIIKGMATTLAEAAGGKHR